ncbi:hypothetical protein B0T19DRAFT_117015 [Cercophora scortea]|uniref:WW domain-containing protein n=1 Tax=Cercophora scortea TaxID=314031 RepID=A0AAE0IXN5_9PEZI|nr:hypothetical protein B0T19DRAFT_117015 [Cercophora scortea]
MSSPSLVKADHAPGSAPPPGSSPASNKTDPEAALPRADTTNDGESKNAEDSKPELLDAQDQSAPPSPSREDAAVKTTERAVSSTPNPRDDNNEPADPPLPNEPLPDQREPSSSPEPGLIDEEEHDAVDPAAPPLPAEPLPEQQPQDDGWTPHFNTTDSTWWFYNRFTGVWQRENPRVAVDAAATALTSTSTTAAPDPAIIIPSTADKSTLSNPSSVAGGYNPAIHGSYDENAWYAQNARAVAAPSSSSAVISEGVTTSAPADLASAAYANVAQFNRWTGQWQTPDQGVERHTDEAKSKRQMNAYFDVDAAANQHDGRSLKAERAGKKPTKTELKAFKEKRRARKEEKRRAWLRD